MDVHIAWADMCGRFASELGGYTVRAEMESEAQTGDMSTVYEAMILTKKSFRTYT
jgi:hypothetical protein